MKHLQVTVALLIVLQGSRVFAQNAQTNGAQSTGPPFPGEMIRPALYTPYAFNTRHKWAVVIGIGKFQNKDWDISFAAKDATDFEDYLVSHARFAQDHVKILLDHNATKSNIDDALEWLGKHVQSDDLALIYIRTRGALADRSEETRQFLLENDLAPHSASAIERIYNGVRLIKGRNFLAAFDSNPDALATTGFDMVDFVDNLVPVGHGQATVIVIDSDFAGTISSAAANPCGIMYRWPNRPNTMQLVTSCNDNEISWQSDKLKNSVFTRAIIDSLILSGPHVPFLNSVESAKNRVKREVQSINARCSQTVRSNGVGLDADGAVTLSDPTDSKQ